MRTLPEPICMRGKTTWRSAYLSRNARCCPGQPVIMGTVKATKQLPESAYGYLILGELCITGCHQHQARQDNHPDDFYRGRRDDDSKQKCEAGIRNPAHATFPTHYCGL